MLDILRFAVLGAAAGSVLALLGLGVNVVFRASRVMNFSSASIAITAAYLYHEYLSFAPVPLAIILAILTGMAVGAVIELIIMRPLRGASTLTKAIATIGVLLVLQSILNLRYGYQPIIVKAWLPTGLIHIGDFAVGWGTVITLLISAAVTFALWLVYKKAPLGLASTALSVNPRSLAALGTWNPGIVSLVNWMIASGLAAFAGVLLAPVTSLTPTLALTLVVPILSVALLGNLSNYWLTFIGGLFIGIAQAELGPAAPTVPGIQDAVPFLILVILLAVRGSSLPARGESAERLPRIASGRIPWIPMLTVFVIVAVLIFVLPTDWSNAITIGVAAATVLVSIVVVTGYAGQLSLASYAMAGVSALVSGLLAFHLGWDLVPAAIVGILATIPVGIIIGLPAVRTRGTALAVITLGLAVAFQSMVLNNTAISNGFAGLQLGTPTFFGLDISYADHPERWGIFTLVCFTIVGILVLNLRRSAAGRRMIAVRGNEAAAAAIGVSVARTKLYAFVVSAVVAGVGGVLIAYRSQSLILGNPGGRFDPSYSISAIAESTTGGIGWVSGAIGGTAMESNAVGYKILQLFSGGSWLDLIAGVLMLVTIITAPSGIAAIQAGQLNALFAKLPGAKARAARRAAKAVPADLGTVEPSRVEPGAVAVRGLSVAFAGNRVLKSVDLDIRPGQVLGVIGPNGAGKTTLLEAITGYNRPQEGSIRFEGVELMGTSPTKRARLGIARSFQSLELFEDLTVLDNLLVASDDSTWWRTLIAGVVPGKARLGGAAKAAVAAFGLENRLADLPGDLSYGERRLLAIARALATRPRVLLLDEPAAGLGASERVELRSLVRRIADEWGIAVLVIEHDVELVMGVSDEVLALDFGSVIAVGTPNEVRNDPAVIAAYLGAEDVPAGEGLDTAFVTVVHAEQTEGESE